MVQQNDSQPPVAAVLFDMDGLLLDTEHAYTVAQQRVLDRFGRTFTWELKAKMMGRQPLDAVNILIQELQLTPEEITAEQFLAERDALLETAFAESALMPGAERLVRHLAACAVPMAVATGSDRRRFELKTSRHRELFALFSHVVTGDMVPRAKPDPAIFLRAVEGFAAASPCAVPDGQCGDGGAAEAVGNGGNGTTQGERGQGQGQGRGGGLVITDMSSVLVFEDAPNGVEAALAGGMRVVMVPYPGLPAELQGDGATQVLGSLAEFRPEQWGLPPFPE